MRIIREPLLTRMAWQCNKSVVTPLITGYSYRIVRRGPSLCSRIHSVFSHSCRPARLASVRASTMLNRPLMKRPLLKNKGHIKIWVQLCLRFCSGIAMKSLKAATSQPPSSPSYSQWNISGMDIVPTCIM